MATAIVITGVGQSVTAAQDNGKGTFSLTLSGTPTDHWRQRFERACTKDYAITPKLGSQPACLEVTCLPSEVSAATEAVKSAVKTTNDVLAEEAAEERKARDAADSRISQIEAEMRTEMGKLKFD